MAPEAEAPLLRRRQEINPAQHQALHRGGHDGAGNLPAMAQKLLQEEGIAAGARDAGRDALVALRAMRLRQPRRFRRRERRQVDGADPGGPEPRTPNAIQRVALRPGR